MSERRHIRRDDKDGFWDVGNNLSAVLNERSYAVACLYDFSVSGAGIGVPLAIVAGTPMQLIFKLDEFVVDIYGKVSWCGTYCTNIHDSSVNLYRIGVEFDARDENLVLFYLAVRSHLSDTEKHLVNVA